MGIYDRHYMHVARDDRPFHPPRQPLWIRGSVMLGIVVASWWGLAKLNQLAQHEGRVVVPTPSTARLRPAPADRAAVDPGLRSGTVPKAIGVVPAESNTTVVYKCMHDGRVTYAGAGGCAGKVVAMEIQEPAPSREPPHHLTDIELAARMAQERIARERAQAQQQAAAAVAAPQPTIASKAECPWLEQTVRDLDAQARMPLSPGQQDWIRQQRQKARDRQNELRC